MAFPIKSAFLGTLILVAVACNPFRPNEPWIYAETPVPTLNPEKPLVVATGDSISAGWMDCRQQVCQGVMFDWWQAAIGDVATVLTRGIGNSTSQDLLERWEQDTAPAQIIIVLVGVNDVSRDVSAETILANFSEMAKRARANQQRIIFSTIIPSDSINSPEKLATQTRVNAELRRRAAEENWLVMDLNAEMVDPANGVYLRRTEIAHEGSSHPNQAGYARMIQFVNEWWRESMWGES